MKDFKRDDLLFSLCGLNCGLCTMHLGGYCPGCGGGEGNQSCGIARCSIQKGGITYCHQCGDYPCERYESIDEFDSFITHQNRRRDMEKHRSAGARAYDEEQAEKVLILKYLLEHFNDGRRKTLYCLAVNLLELDFLRELMGRLKEEEGLAALSVKERAAFAVQLLQSEADKEHIILKLNKKK